MTMQIINVDGASTKCLAVAASGNNVEAATCEHENRMKWYMTEHHQLKTLLDDRCAKIQSDANLEM